MKLINNQGDVKMRLSKRQLKRIIREEYSRLKRRGLIKEGSWSDDPVEDAYMCVSETAEMEQGSKQIVEDLFYVCSGFYPLQDCVMEGFADEYEDWEEMLEDYVDRSAGVSEATAEGWKAFLMELNAIDPSCGNGLAASFSKFWERNYIS